MVPSSEMTSTALRRRGVMGDFIVTQVPQLHHNTSFPFPHSTFSSYQKLITFTKDLNLGIRQTGFECFITKLKTKSHI